MIVRSTLLTCIILPSPWNDENVLAAKNKQYCQVQINGQPALIIQGNPCLAINVE